MRWHNAATQRLTGVHNTTANKLKVSRAELPAPHSNYQNKRSNNKSNHTCALLQSTCANKVSIGQIELLLSCCVYATTTERLSQLPVLRPRAQPAQPIRKFSKQITYIGFKRIISKLSTHGKRRSVSTSSSCCALLGCVSQTGSAATENPLRHFRNLYITQSGALQCGLAQLPALDA